MTRWTLGLVAAWLLAAGLHLVRPDRETHLYEAPMAAGLSYAFNADSPAFARIVVRFPEGLWDCEQGRVRILRPLYPALGRLVYLPLLPLSGLIPDRWAARVSSLMNRANHPEIWAGMDARSVLLAWAALVIVNLGLAFLASLLTMGALARFLPTPEAFWLTPLMILHFNAVDFILVPHSEIFNLLVPALVLDALTRGSGSPQPARATAFLLGVAMLGKALAFPIVSWLPGGTARRKAGLLGLFLLPGALYMILLAATGLPLYNHEVSHYRQGIWMLDWWREGREAEIPLRWARGLAEHAWNLARGFAIPLAATGLLLLFRMRRLSPSLWLARPLLLYATCCGAFWILLGYDQPRLSILHYPWVLAAAGILARTRLERPTPLLACLVCLQVAERTIGLHAR